MKVTKEESDKLTKMWKEAQNTPVIIIASGTKSFAEVAWDRVREYMDEIAKKYGVTAGPGKWGVNNKTLEIFYV